VRTLIVIAVVVLSACATGQPRAAKGLDASAAATGTAHIVTGADPYDASHATQGSGTIDIKVTDVGDRWSPLQNTDLVEVKASLSVGSDKYEVTIDRAMPHHPLSSYTTWFGVALQKTQHGDTGIGTSRLPRMTPELSLWGWARVTRNGQELTKAAPAHVMVTKDGPMHGVMLAVADEDRSLIGSADGYLVAMWDEYSSLVMPTTEHMARHYLGLAVLVALFVGLFWLATTEPTATVRRVTARRAA